MKRLERSRADRVLFGVCGGFAEYFAIDPNIVRVVWVLSVLLGGIGILPYVAAILLMPESLSPGESSREGMAGQIVGLLLIALAIFFFLSILPVPALGIGLISVWSWRLLLPILLLTAGVLLVWPALRGMTFVSPERRFRRSVTNRVLAGVAGGIADATGTDANLVRIAFVLATTLTSGFAVLIYLVLILVMREETVAAPTASAATGPVVVPPPPPPASPPPPPAAPVTPPAETAAAPPSEAPESPEAPDPEPKKRPEEGESDPSDGGADQEETDSDR